MENNQYDQEYYAGEAFTNACWEVLLCGLCLYCELHRDADGQFQKILLATGTSYDDSIG